MEVLPIGTKVKINGSDYLDGTISSFMYDGTIQYKVVYYSHSIRYENWVYDFEISVVEPTTKQQIGFQ